MSNRRKQKALLRSRLQAAEAARAADPSTDEKIHRIIAGASARPAVRNLAAKGTALTPGDKSAIFMNAANVILNDHGGKHLQELKRLGAKRRISLR